MLLVVPPVAIFSFFFCRSSHVAVAYVEGEKRRQQRGRSMQVGANFASSARGAAPFPWRFVTNAQLLLYYESLGPAATMVVQQDTLSCSFAHRDRTSRKSGVTRSHAPCSIDRQLCLFSIYPRDREPR